MINNINNDTIINNNLRFVSGDGSTVHQIYNKLTSRVIFPAYSH